MKLYLQLQTKKKLMSNHKINHKMRTKIAIGIIMMYLFVCTSCSDNQKHIALDVQKIDSIFLFTTDLSILTSTNISPDAFYDFYLRNSKHKATLITDKTKIEGLADILQTLPSINSYTHTDFAYKPIISQRGQIFLLNTSVMDVRALMIISIEGNYHPVWISNTLVEYHKNYYDISNALREYIGGYEDY